MHLQPSEEAKSFLDPSSENSSQPSTSKQIISFDQAELLPPLSERVNDLIGKFQDVDLSNADNVEPAFLAPFCSRGDFLSISAPAGVGKSTFGTDLILGAAHPGRNGIALGGLFRFCVPPEQTIKCAYLDAESSKFRFASVLVRKIEREGLAPERIGCYRYILASDCRLNNVNQREQNSRDLAEALAHDRVQFVVIDTVANVWAPPNINDPEWVFSGLKVFRESCQKFGITVVALSHPNRNAGTDTRSFNPIGSSQQENIADTHLSITRISGNGPEGIQLCLRKSRRAFWIKQSSIVNLRFTPDFGYEPLGNWREIWPTEASTDVLLVTSTKFQVESALDSAHPTELTAQEIAQKLDINARTVRDCLLKLKKDGIVQMVGRGPSSKWRLAK